jgi:uncharacterized membrane protein
LVTTYTRPAENLGAAEDFSLPKARHTDNTRLEAFSDAIFGFAATLLVVSLDVPTSYDELVKNLYGFVAFGVSFAFLTAIWSIHRQFFRRYPLGDTRTLILNTMLLFVVLFFVYPLKFLTRLMVGQFLSGLVPAEPVQMRYDQLRGMFSIYGMGWTAVFGCFALMYAHARKRSMELDFGPNDVERARNYTGHYLIMAAVGVLSVAMALSGIGLRYGVPGFSYMLLGPVLTIYWKWRNPPSAKTPA